jgi:regulator of protease activity HflC (stomatin/prohibitin superfamily)
MAAVGAVLLVLAVLILLFLAASVKIVLEYERAVIFRLGRCVGAKGPGVFFIIPIIDKIRRVNLQIAAVPVASQAVITKDNVTITVDAVAYFQVVDPLASVIKIQNWYQSAQLVAQTTLRSIIGRHELDQMLSERDRINSELQLALDTQTEAWGIKVGRVEIRDVGLPDQMQRAMARQAEAERERRAKIIAAEGELQASQKLSEAANVINASPGALQLRQLQTMVEISAENSSTIIFPIPIEIMGAISALTNTLSGGKTPTPSTTPIVAQASAAVDDSPTTVEETNAMPDVEIPPADIPAPPA